MHMRSNNAWKTPQHSSQKVMIFNQTCITKIKTQPVDLYRLISKSKSSSIKNNSNSNINSNSCNIDDDNYDQIIRSRLYYRRHRTQPKQSINQSPTSVMICGSMNVLDLNSELNQRLKSKSVQQKNKQKYKRKSVGSDGSDGSDGSCVVRHIQFMSMLRRKQQSRTRNIASRIYREQLVNLGQKWKMIALKNEGNKQQFMQYLGNKTRKICENKHECIQDKYKSELQNTDDSNIIGNSNMNEHEYCHKYSHQNKYNKLRHRQTADKLKNKMAGMMHP